MAQGEIKTALARAAEPFTKNLYHCMRCNYCTEMTWEERGIQHVCPTLVHHNPAPGYSGKGYLAAARAILEGEELPISSVVERFFNCTTCGNCEEACPVGLQPAHLVKDVRAAMAEQGLAPAPIAALAANIAQHHNPDGALADVRNRWSEGIDGIAADAPTLYLPGCAASYGASAEARATLSILRQAGVPVRLMPAGEARCCGAPLDETGYVVQAEGERRELAAAISRTGSRRVVLSGAECMEALAGAQPMKGVEVVHAFNLIEQMVTRGQIKFERKDGAPAGAVVGVLDPCHFSKKSHGSAAVAGYPNRTRALVGGLGCEPASVGDEANFSLCCGAAGGMPQMSPQSAARMAEGKLRSFAAAGASAVLSASPLCTAHLRRSQASGLPPVMGLFEFIDKHFQLRPISR